MYVLKQTRGQKLRKPYIDPHFNDIVYHLHINWKFLWWFNKRFHRRSKIPNMTRMLRGVSDFNKVSFFFFLIIHVWVRLPVDSRVFIPSLLTRSRLSGLDAHLSLPILLTVSVELPSKVSLLKTFPTVSNFHDNFVKVLFFGSGPVHLSWVHGSEREGETPVVIVEIPTC